MEVLDWNQCYDDGWQGIIVPDAFAHPAKAAYGLLNRIVEYGLQQGFWQPGSVVGDPFGGIGTTGIVCSYKGLRSVSVELEERFVKLAHENFALHKGKWRAAGDPLPVLVQGDSRRFAEIVGECGAVVTSPPWADARSDTTSSVKGQSAPTNHDPEAWGQSPGQIGNLTAGELDGVIGSPPFSAPGMQPASISQPGGRQGVRSSYRKAGADAEDNYGTTPGQIGALKEGSVDGVVTSPPYAEQDINTFATKNQGKRFDQLTEKEKAERKKGAMGRHGYRNLEGTTPGQIGALKEGSVDGVVTSPPYEDSGGTPSLGSVNKDGWGTDGKDIVARRGLSADYGNSDGQIGRESGETYWEAVRTVYSQVYQCLKPGGVMALIVKAYVKQGKIVDLPAQTEQLLTHLGFDVFLRVRAWLVKETKERCLFEGERVTTKSRKSFFRRLCESKGSPQIDYEVVIWARKP